MNKIAIVLVIMFFLSCFVALAQSQRKIEGLLVNEKGEAVSYAAITEMTANADMLQAVMSDESGCFEIILRSNESYIYITCLGYVPEKLIMNQLKNNYRIVLNNVDYMFDEILVTAQKHAVKMNVDRFVYEMSASPLKDYTTIEALRYIPLLVPQMSGVSILGKSSTIFYINGRKNNMSAPALISYLETLPAKRIRQIEVITNPNGSFRGDGNFGVINILLNEDENEGLKGSAQANVWKTHYLKTQEGLNLVSCQFDNVL